jgi:hypothetical protein
MKAQQRKQKTVMQHIEQQIQSLPDKPILDH